MSDETKQSGHGGPTWLARRLFWIGGHLPLRVIGREEPYLERYFLFRLPTWVPLAGGMQAYLHRFVRSDSDDGLHDHPWRWAATFILSGGYLEQRKVGFKSPCLHGLVDSGVPQGQPGGIDFVARPRRPGSLAFLNGQDFHRVVLYEGREAWTLFVHGPYRKRWGFLSVRPSNNLTSVHLEWRPIAESVGGGTPWWRRAARGKAHSHRTSVGN